MFDVIADVPDVAWAALITGAFLTGQQWLNTGRDTKRRREDADQRELERKHFAAESQKDRDLEVAKLQESQRHDLAESWRKERYEACTLLLTQMGTLHEHLLTVSNSLKFDGSGKCISTDGMRPLIEQPLLDARHTRQKVDIIGSLSTSGFSRTYFEAGEKMWKDLRRAQDFGVKVDHQNVVRLDSNIRHARRDFVRSMRNDLGTSQS